MQLGVLAAVSGMAWSQTLPPRVFFSDLESGPNTGGENNGGAYVTLYGRNFGATRGGGSVSIGGGAAAAYPIWNDTKITVQLGALASTGNIVVTTAVGASNGVPFTVRTGNIFFVTTTGSDSNAGSFASPWRTVLKARDTMQPGDITYARDGVSQTTEDGQGWNAAMLLRNGGTAGRPKALIAYPGATVTIGNINGPNSGIRSTDYSASGGAAPGYWVFAGLLLRGKNEGMVLAGPSSTWRVVGNDFTCPNGNGASACFESSQTSGVKFLGNNVHDTGIATASALYHGVYFSTDSSHIEMGWSKVSNVHGCRGVQIHSSPLGPGGPADPTGYNQYDISIHDNVIHDTQCDGIVIATVDPSKGKVEAYNNVIYNAGKGPANAENSGNWSCIYVTGTTNNGPAGSGTVELYNNTLYNCGTYTTPPWGDSRNAIEYGGGSPNIKVRIRNNIIYQPAGVPYLTVYGGLTGVLCLLLQNCDGINGTNNLFFGNGAAPLNTNLLSSLSSNPALANVSQGDFHLTSASPAVDSGINTGTAADMDGTPRPQGAGYDVGALEFGQGSSLPPSPQLSSLSCTPSSFNSAGSSACTVMLTAGAPIGGAIVSLSDDSTSVSVPASVTMAAGATSASFTTTVSSFSANSTATITASLNGTASTATLTLQIPQATPQLASLSCSPSTIGAGALTTCTVMLTALASSGGLVVNLGSNNAALSVPASVTVASGVSSANFSPTAGTVLSNQIVTLTAGLGGVTRTATVTVTATSAAPAQLSSLNCTPSTIGAGASTNCTVTLTKAAAVGGLVVNLSSNNTALSIPASVTVASGTSSANFSRPAASVLSNQTVTLTASSGGVIRTATVTVTAIAVATAQLSSLSCTPSSFSGASAGSSACTVTLTSGAPAGGAVISLGNNSAWVSIPASVTVAAGANFAVFTATVSGVTTNSTATISAVWGGATRTASLTTTGVSSNCTFYLDATMAAFPDAGGPGRVHVSLGSNGCSWTASSNVPWITISSRSSNSGSGDVDYVVARNATATTRTGTLTIAGSVFTVTQMTGCSFDLSVNSISVPWEGTKATVRLIASNEACPWTSFATTNWAQRYPQNGIGSATIEYTIYPNTNTGARAASIHIGGQTLTAYQLHNPLPADERFVILMYFGFLGRAPSADEISAQVNALRSGSSRTNLAVGLFNSEEFNNTGRFMAGLYVGLIGRDAEYSGWLFQRSAYLSGLTNQLQLVSNFLDSREYEIMYGNPPDDEFVRLLYRNVHRREPSQSELAFDVNALRMGISRVQLASNFLNSAEYRQGSGPRLTAFLQYACLLLRDSEQWERDYWADLMTGGMLVQEVFYHFINSPEISLLLR